MLESVICNKHFPVIGLHFVLYPFPSRIKWAITEGGNMQGHTCMWIFFIIFVHILCPKVLLCISDTCHIWYFYIF